MTLRFSLLVALGATVCACSDPPSPRDASVSDRSVDALMPDASDVSIDRVDAPPPPPPFDAGVAPSCGVAAFTRHVLDQTAGVEAIEAGSFVPVAGGFLLGVRQGTPRITFNDAAPPRRDSIDMAFISNVGFAPEGLINLFDSAPMSTDLSPPSMVRAGDGALVFYRSSRSIQTSPDYTTELRVARVDAQGRRVGVEVALPERGDPFATVLPDGTAFVLSPRIVRHSDAGFVVAAPNVLRVRATGAPVNTMGVDLTGLIPINADSVLMRPTASGAAAVFRVNTDVQTVRFDEAGLVDPRGYYARDVYSARLDDAVVLRDGSVLAWDDDRGLGHTIRVAVTAPDGSLRTVTTLDTFSEASSPVVNVTEVFGGAAVTWIRGVGDAAMLRGAVMQPNGVLRAPVRDLLPVPGADGRMLTSGDGRSLSFVARDRGLRGAGSTGITFGRLCLPE